MDDMIDRLQGIDKKNEIFNLWYEVTFLRMIVSHMVSQSLYLQKVMTSEVLEDCRKCAQKIVQDRFPEIKINFSTSKIKYEKEKEYPYCTHQDSLESHDASHLPSNAT